MAKIPILPFVQGLKTVEDLVKFLGSYLPQVNSTVNGNLRFTDNMKCQLVEMTVTSSLLDNSLSHNLGNINGYLQFSSPTGGVVYDSTSGFNGQRPGVFYLRASQPGIYRVLLFE